MDFDSRDAILKIGEVCEVHGRSIIVRMYKNKNLSDLFVDGSIVRNVSVGSLIEIKKDFISLIGKVDGERLIEDKVSTYTAIQSTLVYQRFLNISLIGYIERNGKFIGGTKELPLIGNEAYVLTNDKIATVHTIGSSKSDRSILIAETQNDGVPVALPIDGLLNTHMAIFGNTGSGKSNTLTSIYKAAYEKLEAALGEQEFRSNCKFLLFDFNGEYIKNNCITGKKEVYDLTTRNTRGKKLPLPGSGILDIEVLSIISEATEKTQKPLLERALHKYRLTLNSNDPRQYARSILEDQINKTLLLADRSRISTVLGYFRSVFHNSEDIMADLQLFNNGSVKLVSRFARDGGFINAVGDHNLRSSNLYQKHLQFDLRDNQLDNFIVFLHIQLIEDLIFNKVESEHVRPVLGKLRQKVKYLKRVFDFDGGDYWNGKNFVVISLNQVNLDVKKLLPLLVAKITYSKKKLSRDGESLNIIIDEAHNILSNESFRETESWKDYRLETFEEIIKEGRKFGTFLTISSQRPNDISNTITSQAHNYFIHRLVNERDLNSISKAVSYIDKITEESIPTLPTGVCIFSGIATQIPLKLKINELPEEYKPDSKTFSFFSD